MCVMKVKVEIPVMGSIDAQTRTSWDGSAVEHVCWDPKDGELCLNRVKPEETLMETCKSIIKFGYRGERLIEPSSSWFLPKFPSG